MRRKGKLRSWNDQKGFGFIDPSEGGKQVFIHISALGNRNQRPEVGQFITYTLSTDKQNRPRAINATLPGHRLPIKAKLNSGTGAAVGAGLFFVIVTLSVVFTKVPLWVLGLYLAASVITFIMYAIDKSAAKSGGWRRPESTLHLLSLVGGWPGALIAQQTLRHKSKKQTFRSVFWVTGFVNVGAFAWMLTPTGAGVVQSWIGGGQQRMDLGQEATIEWAEPRER